VTSSAASCARVLAYTGRLSLAADCQYRGRTFLYKRILIHMSHVSPWVSTDTDLNTGMNPYTLEMPMAWPSFSSSIKAADVAARELQENKKREAHANNLIQMEINADRRIKQRDSQGSQDNTGFRHAEQAFKKKINSFLTRLETLEQAERKAQLDYSELDHEGYKMQEAFQLQWPGKYDVILPIHTHHAPIKLWKRSAQKSHQPKQPTFGGGHFSAAFDANDFKQWTSNRATQNHST
jgi:hypothetical protein